MMHSFFLIFITFAASYAVPMEQISNVDKQQQKYNVNNVQVQDKAVTTQTGTNKNEQNSDKDGQYTAAASHIMENPSYDPTIYSTFLPADAIQQYVNQYGNPYPAASYFPVPGAYAVQTGYEGYLVPEVHSEEPPYSGVLSYIRSLVPRSVFGWMVKGAIYALSAVAIVLFGGALTTAICTLTPLCTISFASLPFLGLRSTAKVVGKALSAEITPERIQKTAELVQTAIEKFSEMQEPTARKSK